MIIGCRLTTISLSNWNCPRWLASTTAAQSLWAGQISSTKCGHVLGLHGELTVMRESEHAKLLVYILGYHEIFQKASIALLNSKFEVVVHQICPPHLQGTKQVLCDFTFTRNPPSSFHTQRQHSKRGKGPLGDNLNFQTSFTSRSRDLLPFFLRRLSLQLLPSIIDQRQRGFLLQHHPKLSMSYCLS
jgi:hypothetical protein